MVRLLLSLSFLFFFATTTSRAAETTSLTINVRSKEASTPLQSTPIVLEQLPSGKTDTILANGMGEATFTVQRGMRYNIYVYVIQIMDAVGRSFHEIPLNGELRPMTVDLSIAQVNEALAAYKQDQLLNAKLALMNGKMPVMVAERFYDSTSNDNPASGAVFKIGNPANGQEHQLLSDDQGFLLIDAAILGVAPGGEFTLKHSNRLEPDIHYAQREGVDTWQYQPYEYSGGVRPEFSYPRMSVPVKRIATGPIFDTKGVVNSPILDKQLSFIASVMVQHNLAIELQGHSNVNSKIDPEIQKSQSKGWADQIAQLLVKNYNVNQELITTVGYGSMFLAVPGTDPSSDDVNRRVVLVIKGQKPRVPAPSLSTRAKNKLTPENTEKAEGAAATNKKKKKK